jgi:PAS domain S-box-containing protein
MNAVAVPVLVVAGITLYAGIYHLGLYVRRRDRADLYFALTCFAMALYDVAAAGLYGSESLEQGSRWQRLQYATIAPVGLAFALFVAAYAEVRLPRLTLGALAALVPVGIFTVFDRSGWTISDRAFVKQIETPFGQVVYYEMATGPLLQLVALAVPILSLAVFWVALQATLAGKKRALPLPLAAGILLGGLMHDTLVANGLVANLYITEYSWFAVMLMMSTSLSNEVVEAAITKQTLREAEERIAITLNSIQDAVITTDNAGAIVHMNPASERLLGISLSTARKRPLTDFVSVRAADTDRAVRDPIQYALSHPADPFGNLPILCSATGEEHRIDQAGAPLHYPDGRLVGAVVVYRDLTVQHKALRELQHSQKMQSMGQLAGGVAHDLNNLLTPIISYAELCRREVRADSPTHTYLGHVLDAAERATQLTRQLLALSRKQILDARVVPLNKCVLESEALLRRVVPEDVSLVVELAEDAGNVRVDPAQMQHVLMNLVANAKDAMPRGGTLTLRTYRERGDTTCLIVTDTGTGMSAEVRSRLFEPFFTTKPRGKGTGLGLATVRGIVEQHGGRISAESEEGVGSQFRITLPIAAHEPVEPTHHSKPAPHAARGTETVLVVEDDGAVRSLTCDALSELGYRVLAAANAKAAEEHADTAKVQLLLTDVVMPGLSGPELYRQLRTKHPALRCLYMSGHADDLLGERGFLERGTHLLRKPFTITTLARHVRDVLDREVDEAPQSGAR